MAYSDKYMFPDDPFLCAFEDAVGKEFEKVQVLRKSIKIKWECPDTIGDLTDE